MIKDKEKNFISAVVYVHNDEERVANFLVNLNNLLQNNFEKYEIICVNDGSSDNSTKEIIEKGATFGAAPISIINMSYHQGVEMSMIAGTDLAIGDFVYEFDSCIKDYADELIVDVYRKSLTGFDIVAASQNTNGGTMTSLFYKLFNKTGGTKDLRSERFRILSRRVLNRIHQNNDTIIYRKAAYYSSGLPYAHISYEADSKIKSQQNFFYRQNLAIDSLIAFTNIGYKLSLTATLFMMMLSTLFILYAIIVKIIGSNVSGGWTTLMCVISLSFFMLFGILSIIIKYLSLILRQINIKKQYLFDSIIKVNKNI